MTIRVRSPRGGLAALACLGPYQRPQGSREVTATSANSRLR